MHRCLAFLLVSAFASCSLTVDAPRGSDGVDAATGGDYPTEPDPVDAGYSDDETDGSGANANLPVERIGAIRRFDLANPMCSPELLDSGEGCPADDDKCMCRPEFDALNSPSGTTGNAEGRVILISQPKFGKRSDGSFAFDAYAAIKANGNVVGTYVNALNPKLSCTAAQSWTDTACEGGGGCGWRCMTGAERADQIVDEQAAAFEGYGPPEAIALNEAWSTLYANSAAGVSYRTWIRNLTRRMTERDRIPLLFVQQRGQAAGPYSLLSETSQYAYIMVEAYLSGREVLNAPGQCAPPYDSTNWCRQQYAKIRSAIRNSANPAISLDRLIMVEHFATNTIKYVDGSGVEKTTGWGRAFDDRAGSPTFGTPTTSKWAVIIQRRARAMKALQGLAGVGSYGWAGNASKTGSVHRVDFGNTYAGIELP